MMTNPWELAFKFELLRWSPIDTQSVAVTDHTVTAGDSEWSFENKRSGAIAVGGFARDNYRRRLTKIIEWLKQAGKGKRSFKGGSCACRLKFRKQMVRANWVAGLAYTNSRSRLWEIIGLLKPTGEGAGQQFPGWIIRLAQRKYKSKLYAVIGVA